MEEFCDLVVSWGLPSDVLKMRAGHLSLGMRQRVELAKALCFRPDMLIIDEGFSGIDLGSKRQVFESVVAYVRKGMTMVAATHQIMDLMRLAERVYFIADGRISRNFVFSTDVESRLRANEEELIDLQDVRSCLEELGSVKS
jgi:ABC-type multidrug transport system ATPase subunit